MATDLHDEQSVTATLSRGTVTESPENPTAVCPGPRLCRVGKTGLVRSSSSFQVKIQLMPKVATAQKKIRLPATLVEEESDSDEDSSEYEVVYETASSSEED